MQSPFTSEFFTQNRQKLKNQIAELYPVIPDLPIIVTANGLLQRGGDSSYLFNQDANFWYLTGINEPDITLLMTGQTSILIVPGRSVSRTAFDGEIDLSELQKTSGITEIVDDRSGKDIIKQALSPGAAVATPYPSPSYLESYGLYVNPARSRLKELLSSLVPGISFHDINATLALSRMVKQPVEIDAIQSAIDITTASLESVFEHQALSDYDYEYQIEAAVAQCFRHRGARGHSFDPIVAGGIRGCTLHNLANDAKLGVDELVVMDVGAEVFHYAADITRTVIRGSATKRQRDVHAAVLATQEYAISLLKPGVLLAEYEAHVETYLGEKLVSLGLIDKIDHQSVRAYCPHATSHFLGLNVHDSGDYGRPLTAGVILTVEPGIYLPEEAIGVRIEDDILITESGNRVLSAGLTRSIDGVS